MEAYCVLLRDHLVFELRVMAFVSSPILAYALSRTDVPSLADVAPVIQTLLSPSSSSSSSANAAEEPHAIQNATTNNHISNLWNDSFLSSLIPSSPVFPSHTASPSRFNKRNRGKHRTPRATCIRLHPNSNNDQVITSFFLDLIVYYWAQ
jgi:hypothetical protein